MPDIQIELPGPQFRRYYLVYIIEIVHEQDHFFYIGQTGDNKALTARPPYRRLSGHLSDSGQSTENQVYRSIAVDILKYDEARTKKKAFSEDVKQGVEDFLVDSSMRMHIYHVRPFRADVAREEHLAIVRDVTRLEQHVIAVFLKAGRTLMNKKVHEPGTESPYADVLSRIKNDFSL